MAGPLRCRSSSCCGSAASPVELTAVLGSLSARTRLDRQQGALPQELLGVSQVCQGSEGPELGMVAVVEWGIVSAG